MTYSQLDAMLAESGFAADETSELSVLLAPLTEVGNQAPAPSAELMSVFRGDPAARVGRAGSFPVRLRRGSRGAVAGAVVLALSGVGATGLSAAANTLPSPLQHQVSEFSHNYLPFNFPEPAPRRTRDRRDDAPDAARAPKPGSAPGVDFEPRDPAEVPSRSLDRRPRMTKAAPAWGGHEPVRRDGAAHEPSYSAPRAQRHSAPRDQSYSGRRHEETSELTPRYWTESAEVPSYVVSEARPRSDDKGDHRGDHKPDPRGPERGGDRDNPGQCAGPDTDPDTDPGTGPDADGQGQPGEDPVRGNLDHGDRDDTGEPDGPRDDGGFAERTQPVMEGVLSRRIDGVNEQAAPGR